MGNESSDSGSSGSSDEELEKENNDSNIISDNIKDKYISFENFKVKMYMQYFGRLYVMDISSDITNICCLYLGKIMDCFDSNNKGERCKLSDSNTICTLSSDGAITVYGTFRIKQIPYINAYKWKFKIIKKKLNIFIGIDSNPNFARTDFSNYFRNFNTKHEDIFCSYGSDGNIYHYISRDAHVYGSKWKENDEIEMVINMKEETLSYYVNGEYQGIAMNELSLTQKQYAVAVALFYQDDAVQLTDFMVNLL